MQLSVSYRHADEIIIEDEDWTRINVIAELCRKSHFAEGESSMLRWIPSQMASRFTRIYFQVLPSIRSGLFDLHDNFHPLTRRRAVSLSLLDGVLGSWLTHVTQ